MNKLHKLFNAGKYLGEKLGAELNVLTITDDREDFIIYQCRECGYWTKSLGFLHGHLEGHTPWWSIADIDRFNSLTRKIVVTEFREENIEDTSTEYL